MSSEEKTTKVIDPDFPFYNENPKIETWGILLFAAAVIYTSISIFVDIPIPGYVGAVLFCAVPLAAYLIASRGNMSLIVKKFKAIDFVRIIVTLILQYVFVVSIGVIRLLVFHIEPSQNGIMDVDMMNGNFWLLLLVQLFGEEMYKLLIFLLALILIYRVTKKRTMSVVAATVIMLLCFALAHADAYGYNWTQILLNQGLFTIFSMYNYLRSKNILTSYLQHVILDAIPFIMSIAGVFTFFSNM